MRLLWLTGISFILFGTTLSAREICNNACISGDCKNTVSLQVYTNCDKYEGAFSGGRRHGPGEYTFANGDIYKGEFLNGNRAGKGIYYFKSGQANTSSLTFDLDVNGTGTGILRANQKEIPCKILRGEALCGIGTRLRISEKMDPIAIVLYAGDSARIDRKGEPIAVSSGDPILPGDSIRSGSDNVDLQFKDNIAVRAKPGSNLAFPREQDRRIDLKEGAVTVKFGQDSGSLAVTAPAARVDADDSTFAVQTTAQKTDVKVFEINKGKVTVAPAIPELSGKSDAEIRKDPELSKLQEKQRSLSTVLNVNQSGNLDRGTTAKADVKPFVPTVREKFESKVIVLADPEAVKKLSQDPGNAQAKIAMKQDYEKKLDRAASSVETDLSESPVSTEEDVMRRYGLVEYVQMLDKKMFKGCVVAQAGDTLILHGLGAVRRIKVSDVNYIEYRHPGERAPEPSSP